MNICVFGAASTLIDKSYTDAGFKLGVEMGKRGHTLIFGAGTNGMMGAVARGVKDGGGDVIGIVPKFFTNYRPPVIFEGCNDIIYTDTMTDRKQKMIDLSEAFVVTPGGIGTYDELFEILTLKHLNQINSPIAFLDTNGFYDRVIDLIDYTVKEKFLADEIYGFYDSFTDSVKLVDYLENNIKK